MMVATKFEDRLLDAVRDVEVAAVDTSRDIAHRVSDLVPAMAADLTEITDAGFDFAGRLLELQLEVTREVVDRARGFEAQPSAARKSSDRPKKRPPTAKKAA